MLLGGLGRNLALGQAREEGRHLAGRVAGDAHRAVVVLVAV